MALQEIDWGDPPASTNLTDSTTYAMGCEFTVSETTPCHGAVWWVPDSVTPAPAGGVYYASLFLGGAGQVAKVAFIPEAGGNQYIPWDTPVDLTAGNTWTVQVYTERYVYRGDSAYPYATPDGIVSATRAVLRATTDTDQVADGNAAGARFYVGPWTGTPDDGVTAAITVTLPPLAASAAAEAAIGAAVTLTLPAVRAAAVADVDGPAAAGTRLSAVMDEIAAVVRAAGDWPGRVWPHPVAKVGAVPAAVLSYPETLTFGRTYRPQALPSGDVVPAGPVQGMDQLTLTCFVDRLNNAAVTSRDQISAWAYGAGSLVNALESRAWESCDVVTVPTATIGQMTLAGVEYLVVQFSLDILGYGP